MPRILLDAWVVLEGVSVLPVCNDVNLAGGLCVARSPLFVFRGSGD